MDASSPPSRRRSHRVSFVGGTGFELAGIVDSPDGSPLATAVFTHCFTCNKDLKAIVRISRRLAELGVRVLRYDLTGLGNSRGNFSDTNFSTNQADLRAAVAFLAENYEPPTALIGHSFGGICSLSVASSLPSVRGVVTLAAPSDTQHLADLLERKNPAIRQQGLGEVVIGGRTYTIPQAMLDDFRRHDVAADLQRLSKPCLLLHSPEDETLGYDHALRLFSLLNSRSVAECPAAATSLITLPGADHLLSNQPQDLPFVATTITAFLHRYCPHPA
ncbi:MAG: alpha/beta fold hydrolase [Planctomycetota bacterium]|nr:MAG: alpha/beta fold hydrolase [Planctomycetota bacterium]